MQIQGKGEMLSEEKKLLGWHRSKESTVLLRFWLSSGASQDKELVSLSLFENPIHLGCLY